MLAAVLLLWIYVVYNKNRYILALMSVCYVAEVAGVVTILGISFKTQALYVAVFVTRYLDLFLGEWVSLCNTLMKLFFIGSSCYMYTLYLMKYRFR